MPLPFIVLKNTWFCLHQQLFILLVSYSSFSSQRVDVSKFQVPLQHKLLRSGLL